MTRTQFLSVAMIAATMSTARHASAEVLAETSSDDLAPASTAEAPLPGPLPEAPAPARRGRFSGRRLVVEMLAGALVGGAAGYAAYRQAGGDGAGPAFLGLGANIVVTPLVVYGTGRVMGGEGSLGSSYYGALFGLSAPGTYATAGDAYAVTLAIGMAIMPVTSALFYEVSSNMRSQRAATITRGLSLAPVITGDGVTGVQAGLALPL